MTSPAPGPAAQSTAHGTFQVTRAADGEYYGTIDLDTALGHIAATVHLHREHGALLEHLTQGAVIAAPGHFDAVGQTADAMEAQLATAAAAQNIAPEVLHLARLYIKAHLGDQRAKAHIHHAVEAAKAGDPHAIHETKVLHTARHFARRVLGQQLTGAFLGNLGRTLEHSVHDLGRDVGQVERRAGKIVRTVGRDVKRWGPMIVSDIQGVVSMIPGIGTGISSAISTAMAVLHGGGPISIALHAAYGAIPIPPGIRPITDKVLDTVFEFVKHPSQFIDAGVGVARDRIPAGLPREVFDTLVRVLGHHHHVVHAPEALARHAIGQYTHGHAPNLALGLAHLVPPAIAEHLAALPDPSIAFKSIHDIAPHFAVNPHDAEAIMAHAQAAAGVSLPPEHVAALVQGVQTAVQAQAEHAAAMRVAQQAHLAPRIDAAEPRAQIAVQVSPDGASARIHASSSLADVAQTVHAGAVL